MDTHGTAGVVDDGYQEYSNPVRKRKLRSQVWNELLIDKNAEGERTAKCPYCGIVLSAITTSGTSHLKRHLDRCRANAEHGEEGDDNGDGDAVFEFDMDKLRRDILLYIVEGGHSFSTVEERGFKRMMLSANPKFESFSRFTVQRDLLSCYATERESLKKLLEGVGRICLTTDMCKSNHTNQHYICVTAHFVDSNWKLHKAILRFRALDPPFDGVSIANEIEMFLSQWNLDHKILTITTDNATYNDVMMSNLKRRLLPKGGLMSGGYFFQIRCSAHIVNLVVQSGLKSIHDILEKLRTLIKMIIRASRKVKDFNDSVKVFRLDVKRKLCLDMPIRWNSTHKMLDSVIYFKVVLNALGSSEPLKSYLPTEYEWEKVSVMHNFLKLFNEVTCLFSSVKSPTSNLFFKGAWMIHRQLVEALDSPYDYLADMVHPMIEKFKKYWSDYNLYLSCVAILDPRYKVKFVEYCFTKLFGVDEAMERITAMLGILRSLFNEYKQTGSSPLVVSPSPPTLGLGSGSFFDDYNTFQAKSIPTQVRKSQLDSYLDEPPHDLNEEIDVLDFWCKSSTRFPDLSRMARDLLTIPVSTVASESAFSLGGKTISSHRSSLMPKTVQALICLQDWRRGEYDVPIELEIESSDDSDEYAHEEENDDDDDVFI